MQQAILQTVYRCENVYSVPINRLSDCNHIRHIGADNRRCVFSAKRYISSDYFYVTCTVLHRFYIVLSFWLLGLLHLYIICGMVVKSLISCGFTIREVMQGMVILMRFKILCTDNAPYLRYFTKRLFSCL